MFKNKLLLMAFVISMAMVWSNSGWAFNRWWGFGGSTTSLSKIQMKGEGECDQIKPYGDCGVEVAAIIPNFDRQSGEEDDACKTFAPMSMINEDPYTWVPDYCRIQVALFEDNPNTTERKKKPDTFPIDPNSFKWSRIDVIGTSGLDFTCDKNGACWAESVWSFEELFGNKKKNWVYTAMATKSLVLNAELPRGFVCGTFDAAGNVIVDDDGYAIPDGNAWPARNNLQCCSSNTFTVDGHCVEGEEVFTKVACEDSTRNTDAPYSEEQPACTPLWGTFQKQGDPTKQATGIAEYQGRPNVELQLIDLGVETFEFVFGTEGLYPSAYCPGPEDQSGLGFDGLDPRTWNDCGPVQ